MFKIQMVKQDIKTMFRSLRLRILHLFRASPIARRLGLVGNFEFRVSNRTGFTLIETVVATGLFAVLALTAVSIMLSVVKAQTHIQRVQSAIDNIRFSLELITKEMRVGTQYRLVFPNECGDINTHELNFVTSFPPAERRYFIQSGRLMRIKKSSTIVSFDCSSAVPFTADEVRIDHFRVLLPLAAGSSNGQPWATLNLKITALDPKGVSNFSMNLQTSVVQRARALP